MAKSGKSVTEKLKSFFKSSNVKGGTAGGNGVGGGHVSVSTGGGGGHDSFVLTSEMIAELSQEGGGGVQARMGRIRELIPLFREQPLEDVNQIELIYYKTRDLLASEDPDQRADIFSLYQALVKLQYEDLGIRRAYFFALIKESPCNVKRTLTGTAAAASELVMTPDPDLVPRIGLLDALSNGGKDVTHFETELGPLLKRFFPHINNISGQATGLFGSDQTTVGHVSIWRAFELP